MTGRKLQQAGKSIRIVLPCFPPIMKPRRAAVMDWTERDADGTEQN